MGHSGVAISLWWYSEYIHKYRLFVEMLHVEIISFVLEAEDGLVVWIEAFSQVRDLGVMVEEVNTQEGLHIRWAQWDFDYIILQGAYVFYSALFPDKLLEYWWLKASLRDLQLEDVFPFL